MNPPAAISPSTQLLLDEMRKLFAEQQEWWDQRFSTSFSAAASVASVTAPAPAASTSVAPASSATPTSTTAASPTSASAASTATVTSIDPVARGAKEAVDINSPLRCSTVCRSANARELVPMSTTAAATTAFSDTIVVDPGSKGAGEQVPAEQFANGVDLHDFPCDDHDQAPPRRVNLDALPVMLALDAAATAVSPIRIQEREGDLEEMEVDEFIEGGLAASRPRRAPPRPPRPRRPRRAPLRAPRPRHPRRAPLRVPRLRRPRRAPPRPPRPRRPRAPPRPIRPPRRRPPRPPWLLRLNSAALQELAPLPPGAVQAAEELGVLRALVLAGVASTTIRTPLRPPPTRCSTLGNTHDESSLVPVRAALDPSSTSSRASSAPRTASTFLWMASVVLCGEEDIFTRSTRCSAFRLSQDRNKHKGYSFGCSQQRYITTSTPTYSVGVLNPYLAIKANAAQNRWEGIILLNSVLLQPLPVTVVDRGPEPKILNVEIVDSLPKPTWPVVYLADDSCNGDSATQICLNFWMWIICGLVTRKQSPLWPSLKYRCHIFLCENIQICFWLCLSFNGDRVTAQQRSPCSTPLLDCQNLFTDSLNPRPIPWPSLDWHTVDVQLENILSLLFGCFGSKRAFNCEISQLRAMLSYSVGVLPPWPPPTQPKMQGAGVTGSCRMLPSYCAAIWLEFTVRCCWMQCDTSWSVSLLCLYMSSDCVVSSTDNWLNGRVTFIWWQKIKLSTLPAAYSLCEAVSFSGQWLKMILLHKFLLSSVSSSWIQVQTQNVTITKSLLASSTLCWLSYNGMIPNPVLLLAHTVPDQKDVLQGLAFLFLVQQRQQQQFSVILEIRTWIFGWCCLTAALYGGILGVRVNGIKELSDLNQVLYQQCNSSNKNRTAGQGEEIFRDAGNIMIKLHFYNLAIEDP